MKKKLLKLCLGPTAFDIYVTDYNVSNYTLAYNENTKAEMYITVKGDLGICMANLMHETIEAWFHMNQLLSEPIYIAASFSDRRTFHFDHIQFSDAMVDAGIFIKKVWPKLLRAKDEYENEKKCIKSKKSSGNKNKSK